MGWLSQSGRFLENMTYLFEIVSKKDGKTLTEGEIEAPTESAVRKMFTLASGTELYVYEDSEPMISRQRAPLMRLAHH
jgi:hypothetical protein